MATPIDGQAARKDSPEVGAVLPLSTIAGVPRYIVGALLSGKYRLDALLGQGGMGSVWRATNVLLDLPVAIKLIRADLDRNALRARLQVEARSVAKLGHPAIVRVYDVGETEWGDPFIVMELLHGETLAQLLARGRLSAARAVQLLLPIIDACAAAHARGIVHRDLKPDNLLIAAEDQRLQPKILDFGVAKLTDPRDADHRLTEIGTVVGSPEYMSPEQARGSEDVDYRTDIWAVCVVLYEAITGEVPFTAPNYNALLRAIVEDTPKALSEYTGCDAAFWAILERGLSKDRAQRQRSMAELGRALAAWLSSHGTQQDACGTALDSNWLTRSSDPFLISEGAASGAPASNPARGSKRTHDSLHGPGVDSRGPFTATIRAKSPTHARKLRALTAGGALLGALLVALAFVIPSRHHTEAVAVSAPAELGAERAVEHAAATPISVSAAVVRADPEPSPTAIPSAAPTRYAVSRAAMRAVVAPSPPRAAQAPAQRNARTLDLISPY